MDGWTNGQTNKCTDGLTNGETDTHFYKDVRTHLEMGLGEISRENQSWGKFSLGKLDRGENFPWEIGSWGKFSPGNFVEK